MEDGRDFVNNKGSGAIRGPVDDGTDRKVQEEAEEEDEEDEAEEDDVISSDDEDLDLELEGLNSKQRMEKAKEMRDEADTRVLELEVYLHSVDPDDEDERDYITHKLLKAMRHHDTPPPPPDPRS